MRRFYPLRVAATLLLIGSLAACTAFEADAPAPAKPTAAAKVPAKKPATKTAAAKPGKAEKAEPAAPAAEPRPEVVQEPVAEAVAPEPPPVAVAPPRPTGPVDLVGKREEDVVALLGRPASENPSSPGKVLSFSGDGCAIQVHLFPDVKQGGYRALELIATGGDLAPEHCAGKIRSARS